MKSAFVDFKIPFVYGCCILGDALRRIHEGATRTRTKGEDGTSKIIEAVLRVRSVMDDIFPLEVATPMVCESYKRELSELEAGGAAIFNLKGLILKTTHISSRFIGEALLMAVLSCGILKARIAAAIAVYELGSYTNTRKELGELTSSGYHSPIAAPNSYFTRFTGATSVGMNLQIQASSNGVAIGGKETLNHEEYMRAFSSYIGLMPNGFVTGMVIIYFNSDLMVVDDVAKLWQFDLGTHVFRRRNTRCNLLGEVNQGGESERKKENSGGDLGSRTDHSTIPQEAQIESLPSIGITKNHF
ncbi:hypothetical protein NE237_025617 [Protea cynaroides]|uniref:PdxS/SNZ N-terminal domain-containing protein n=1 Tax=Protea cynaroides TaxID=273540 RepID=A0A9Q0H289_9MAGN|nr:hypothetical protein NE237_025617 [Protea cynaroides]